MKPLKLTESEIAAGMSRKGGFTRAQLAKWGVPWPPPQGWRKALLAGNPVPKPERDPYKPDMQQSDAHSILRQVVVAVLNAGHASDLYEFPDVMRHFGARPDARPVAHVDIGDLFDD